MVRERLKYILLTHIIALHKMPLTRCMIDIGGLVGSGSVETRSRLFWPIATQCLSVKNRYRPSVDFVALIATKQHFYLTTNDWY